MENKIIFLHIPKTGGMSFLAILDRIYKDKGILNLSPYTEKWNTIEELKEMTPKTKSEFQLFRGHIKFGVHNYIEEESDYITFLRNPIDRIISFYYFIKRRKKDELYKYINENNISFLEFVKVIDNENFTDYHYRSIHNALVKHISGIDDKGPLMLEKAMENIEKHFSFIGLTERFDESLVLLQKMYGWDIPYYKVKNKSSGRPAISDINEETIKIIRERNKEDIQLYKFIEERLEKQIQNAPNIKWDLWRLKMACKLYSTDVIRTPVHQVKSIFKKDN